MEKPCSAYELIVVAGEDAGRPPRRREQLGQPIIARFPLTTPGLCTAWSAWRQYPISSLSPARTLGYEGVRRAATGHGLWPEYTVHQTDRLLRRPSRQPRTMARNGKLS
jgi:hypothetical protein